METKICECCGRELPIENFGKGRASGVPFVHKICNECLSMKKREGHAKRKAERENKKEYDVEYAKKQRLSEFTPRELMQELRRRGYEGELTYTEVKRINLSSIEC